jgi:predicted neuraminidase
MKARIVERKWVQEYFDERQCNHMPSLKVGYDGTLLATWCGGMMHWNADPMGRDCTIWLSRLERGSREWTCPEGVGTDMKYACHNGSFFENRHGHIYLIFAKYLDTYTTILNWAKNDKLWYRKSLDGGFTWLPAQETNIPTIGFPACDGVLAANGDMVMAISSVEDPERFLGSVRILRSTDDGKTWQSGQLLQTEDGSKIREPAITLRPDGSILMFTRNCPLDVEWGQPGDVRKIYAYTSKSTDNGKTWSTPKPSTITNNESKLDVISWPDGSILMGYNNTINLDWHERSPLTLAHSKDEGQTWENLIDIAPAPGIKCQPALCRGPDGLLNIIYMHRHTAVEHVVVELKS